MRRLSRANFSGDVDIGSGDSKGVPVGCTVGDVTSGKVGSAAGITVGKAVGVSTTDVKVGALVAAWSPPCSKGEVPQAPISNTTRIIKDTIGTHFDPFIRENISTSNHSKNWLKDQFGCISDCIEIK